MLLQLYRFEGLGKSFVEGFIVKPNFGFVVSALVVKFGDQDNVV